MVIRKSTRKNSIILGLEVTTGKKKIEILLFYVDKKKSVCMQNATIVAGQNVKNVRVEQEKKQKTAHTITE